jgi:hypothetical protein
MAVSIAGPHGEILPKPLVPEIGVIPFPCKIKIQLLSKGADIVAIPVHPSGFSSGFPLRKRSYNGNPQDALSLGLPMQIYLPF